MNSESKTSVNWGMMCHVAGLSAYVGLPVVGPLVIWLAKRKTDDGVREEGREAVNFNLSFAIYGFVAGLFCMLLIGYFILPVIFLTHLVLVIWATLKANKGERVRYPFTLRFIN